MTRTTVASVESISAGWTRVVLENGTYLAVYVNWFTKSGELKPGDPVEYDPDPVRNFRRAPKEVALE